MRIRSFILVAAAALASIAIGGMPENEATVGTELTFKSDTDLGTKKPKVKAEYLGPIETAKGDPKLKLKVTGNTTGNLNLLVRKAKGSGLFDIRVTPKGGESFVIGQVNTVPPRPESVSSETVSPGDELTITGTFFGKKKPKVFVNDKKAKTLTATNTELRIRTHKKTPSGEADIVVTNKIGSGTIEDAVTVDEGGGGGGAPGNSMDFTTRGDARIRFRSRDDDMSGTWSGSLGFTIDADSPDREASSLAIASDFDLDSATPPQSFDLVAASGDVCAFTDEAGGGVTYALGTGDGTSASIRIVSWDPATRVLRGELDAELKAPGGDTVEISGANFTIQLSDERS